MNKKTRQGQFQVIDSFAIRRRNEFYLIGQVLEGEVQENWFINVPFNESLSLTIRINTIEDIEISSEEKKHKLLIVSCEEDSYAIDFFLGMGICSEYLDITIEGQD